MTTIMINKSTIQFKTRSSHLIIDIEIDIDKEIGETPKIVTELKAKGIVIKYIDCGEKLAKFISKCVSNNFKNSIFILSIKYM